MRLSHCWLINLRPFTGIVLVCLFGYGCVSSGWESSHRLEASILTLKHAAAIGEKGILTYFLKRTRAGVTDVSAYELKVLKPALLAVEASNADNGTLGARGSNVLL